MDAMTVAHFEKIAAIRFNFGKKVRHHALSSA
jgi:hypothetical protein